MKTEVSRYYAAVRYLVVIPLLVIGGLLATLAGCGGGGGSSSTPTPTDVLFQLFAPGNFSSGHTKTYHLTGSDTFGDKFTATETFTTGAQTTFNAQPAIPVQAVLSITDTTTSVAVNVTGFDYYSTDPANLMYLGWTNSLGEVFTGTSLGIIPQSATIGTSPINLIGTYAGSGAAAGDTETQTWQLTNANNGLANLIEVSTRTGANPSTETDTFVIDQQGNVLSITVKLVVPGDTLNLSGS